MVNGFKNMFTKSVTFFQPRSGVYVPWIIQESTTELVRLGHKRPYSFLHCFSWIFEIPSEKFNPQAANFWENSSHKKRLLVGSLTNSSNSTQYSSYSSPGARLVSKQVFIWFQPPAVKSSPAFKSFLLRPHISLSRYNSSPLCPLQILDPQNPWA